MSDCTGALPPNAVTLLQRHLYIPKEKLPPAHSSLTVLRSMFQLLLLEQAKFSRPRRNPWSTA